MWSRLRRWALLYVLVLVAGSTWMTRYRVASWEQPLWVVVHPINADASAASAAFIAGLDGDAYAPIEHFMSTEASQHGVDLARPVHVVLGETVSEQPPLPASGAGPLSIMAWSLRLRWWAWRVDRGDDPPPAHVQIFVRYFDPELHPALDHSVGLREGMIGVVNAFAAQRQSGSNQVVIAHELMHTLGAGDRYDPSTSQPLWPEGYADPHVQPLFPQWRAELMGGRIPQNPATSYIPDSLDEVMIGAATAAEIGWATR